MRQRSSGKPHHRVTEAFTLDPRFPFLYEVWEQNDSPITRMHRHNGLELGYCHRGQGIFAIETKTFDFGPGDVVVVGPDEHHFAQSAPGTTSRWTFCLCDPQVLVGLPRGNHSALDPAGLAGPLFANRQRASEAPRLSGLAAFLSAEVAERKAGWQDLVRALMWAIMLELQRIPGHRTNLAPDRRSALDRIAPAVNLLVQKASEEVSITELARASKMSVASLRRAFQNGLQCSPKQYQQRLRIQHAARLLNQGASVLEAGLAAGFSSPSNFYRQFLDVMGVPPKKWQKGDA